MEYPPKIEEISTHDSFRLSTVHETLAEPVSDPLQAIVPAGSLKEFLAVSPDQGSVEMRFEAGRVAFRLENLEGALQSLEIVTLLIEGQFPDFAEVVPKSHATRAILDLKTIQIEGLSKNDPGYQDRVCFSFLVA